MENIQLTALVPEQMRVAQDNLMWNQTLKLRNEIQQLCLKNNHSYAEEMKIDVPDGVTIETVIGGRENGLINWTPIGPDNNFFIRISEHLNQVKKSYEECNDKIIKDL